VTDFPWASNKRAYYTLPTDVEGLDAQHVRPYIFYLPDDPAILGAVLGGLRGASRWYAWERDAERSGARTGQYVKKLLEKPEPRSPATGGLGFHQGVVAMLRSVGCILQQSIDNGLTWHTVMDISDCVGRAVDPLLRQQADDLFQRLRDLYDAGGVPEAFPDLIYGDANDSARDVALCNAWQILILFLLHVESARRAGIYTTIHNGIDTVDDFSDALTHVGMATRQPGAAKAMLVANTISLVVRIGVTAFQALDEAVLGDTSAAREVACCAYISMAGATATSSAFRDALDNCSDLSINATLIAGAVAYLLDDLRMFLSFLAYQRDLYELAAEGILDDCACGTVCIFDYDLSTGTHEWDIAPDPFDSFTIVSGNCGSYSAGNGFVHGDMRRSDNSYHRVCAIARDTGDLFMKHILQVAVTLDYVKGAYTNQTYHVFNIARGPVGGIIGLMHVQAGDASSGTDISFEYSGSAADTGRVFIRARSSGPRNTASYEGSVLIKHVRIVGICDV
jgi:hypothetical protein